jgi:hypothetical protein
VSEKQRERRRADTHHLILVLDEELDTLNGGSAGLSDGLEEEL